jgi:capsular exopolysaccharide synthesis family protein
MFLEPRLFQSADDPGAAGRSSAGGPRAGEAAPQEVFAAVWQRRWVVAWTFALCVGSAAAYLRLAPPVYTATSRLYVTPALPEIGQSLPPERSRTHLNTQVALLRSTPILAPVAAAPDMAGMKTFAGAGPIDRFLKENLVVEAGNNDDLIELSFDSTDPAEAARVVNAVVESYVAHQSDQKRSSARELLKILRNEKEARQRELAAQRLAVLKFKEENALLASRDDRNDVILARLAQLSEAKTAAQLDLMSAAATHEALRAALSDPRRRADAVAALAGEAAPAAADRTRSALEGELHQSELQLTVTSRQLGAAHPAVAALREGVAQARRKLADMDLSLARARLAAMEQAWVAAKQRLEAVDGAFQEQQRKALELNATAAKLAALESGAQQAQELVEGIEARIRELGVSGETGALEVTVLERAVPPDKPGKPRKPLVLVAAGLLGVVLGSFLAFLRASTDRRLRSSEQIEDALGVPVLSAIPRTPRRLPFRPRPPALAAGPEVADAYGTIRTAICMGNRGRSGKTLLVTSAVKGEGKSTLARNLAAAMARAGERTLLVDADLRRPTLHKAFKVDDEAGLSTALDPGSRRRVTVQSTEVEHLYLLPGGPKPANPSELLSGPRLERVLAKLSKHYDRIVVDAPPVLGMPDALILGVRCDATLLVVRAGVSDRRATEAAFAALVNIGVRSIATVANAVRSRDGYSRYSRRYYCDAARVPPPVPREAAEDALMAPVVAVPGAV